MKIAVKNVVILLIFSVLITKNSYSSDLIQVSALNSRIIMLQFDDGYARYHKKGESRTNEWVVVEPLNVTAAAALSNYEISCNGGFYSTPRNPLKIARKTKGTEFTWLCDSWSGSVGCVNSKPDHAKEHWIYLQLPEPLEMGKTYTISTKNLANNGNTWTIDFSLEKNRSEAIHVNLVGYDPKAPVKFGYVYHWSGDGGGIDFANYNGNNFYLMNKNTGQKVFTGILKFRKDKNNKETYQATDTPQQNFLGADVYECDFSSYKTPGEYILAVDGIGHSFPFVIKPDAMRLAFYTSIRGLYHNRSGIALEEPFTKFTRPAPQNPLISPGFSGKLKYTSSRFVDWTSDDYSAADKPAIVNGIKGSVDTWGWYQDAGDWDGYISHLRIPVMLMLTWEAASQNFADGELNLPEGKNSIPDIIDEARWLIRYFHRTRNELIKKGYGTGGVGARVAPDWFGEAPGGIPSYEDTRQWIISGEDPFTTYFYAGLAAHYALILKKLNVTEAENIDWLKEAEEAYLWAKNNTKANDLIPSKVLGFKLPHYRLYSASALFRLTGKTEYENMVLQDAAMITSGSLLEEDQKWGVYTLLTGKENIIGTAGFMDKMKSAVIATADRRFTSIDIRACRYGGDMYFPMLVGHGTTPMVFEVAMGHFVSKDYATTKTNAYLAGLYTSADYFLGCNPLNMTYVTHLGVRYPERVFHIDSWYNKNGEMVPGIIPYGHWIDQTTSSTIGPWDIHWPYKTLYPDGIAKWPGHERWYNNYTTPMNAEFTVHQNTVLAAAVYGYICDVPDGSFKANNIPSIQINSPKQNAQVNGDVQIEVAATDLDGTDDIAWVEYYNDWHKIGESHTPPFTFIWKKPKYGTVKLSAKVVDKRGFNAKSAVVQFSAVPMNYDVTIVVTDSISKLTVDFCQVKIQDSVKITDNKGKAFFKQVSGLMNISMSKKGYITKSVNQLSIYSDTTLNFVLAPTRKSISLVVRDSYTTALIQGASVVFNSLSKLTGINGNVVFNEYNGTYPYSVTKNSYHTKTGSLSIVSDTVVNLFISRSNAELKFSVYEGALPVGSAKVIVKTDTILTSALGAARFLNMTVPESYNFKVIKAGYNDVSGSLVLKTDTTVNITLQAWPVGSKIILADGDIKIWPNPSSQFVNISSTVGIRELMVYNLSGSRKEVETNVEQGVYRFSLKNFDAGVYLMEIVLTNGESFVHKIIKN